MALKLPRIDNYRASFIEPLGHLVICTAEAEEKLIELCSVIPYNGSGMQIPETDVAHRLRNYGKDSVKFIRERLSLITDSEFREHLEEVVDRFLTLYDQRSRAIHDVISLQLNKGEGGYYLQPIGKQHVRSPKQTSFRVYPVTPESIAKLSCNMARVRDDLQSWIWQIEENLPQETEYEEY